ncbi:MAG: hypothetical protein WKG03_04605 [Telluria sp.]
MNTRLHSIATLLALAGLTGCVQTSPQWERNFGTSVRASLAAQVADPAASSNRNPVVGLDGRAAAAAAQRYENSFKGPVEQQPMVSGKGR